MEITGVGAGKRETKHRNLNLGTTFTDTATHAEKV
jgi:hypothetical protein